MKTVNIVAFFESEIAAQRAINDLIIDGFDSTDIALLIKNKDLPDDSDQQELENNHVIFDPLDEQYEEEGLIAPLEAIVVTDSSTEPTNSGNLVVGGSLIDEIDTIEENQNNESILIDTLLLSLGIPDEDLSGYEGRVENGEILIAIEVEKETSEEYKTILSNHGPVALEVFDI